MYKYEKEFRKKETKKIKKQRKYKGNDMTIKKVTMNLEKNEKDEKRREEKRGRELNMKAKYQKIYLKKLKP